MHGPEVVRRLPGLAVKVVFTDNNGTDRLHRRQGQGLRRQVKAKSVTGILAPFLRSVYMKSTVEMRAEKQLTLANAEDTASEGANWSWC